MEKAADEKPAAEGPPAQQAESTGDGVLAQMEEKAQKTQSSGSESEEKSAAPEQKPQQQQDAQNPPEEKKPSKLKQLWEKTGLDAQTLKIMFKGSLPPTIGIAMYQAPAIAETYQTVGYLIAISSVLGFCIMPRGKFIQTMTLNLMAICLGAAVNLLALFCAIKARQHTTPPPTPGVPPQLYNASASTICALWLIVQIYVINVIRASRPQFIFPTILFSIFCVVSLTYGVVFPDIATAEGFIQRLLETFLTGFALATGVHFVVFPMSSREVVFKEMTGYMMLLNGLLKCETAYMASMENYDPLAAKKQREEKAKEEAEKSKKHKKKDDKKSEEVMITPPAVKLREVQGKVLELQAKLEEDITPAKREFAIGKLESHDLTELYHRMRQIFVPIIGLSSMISLLERQAEIHHWAEAPQTDEQKASRDRQMNNLHFLMKHLHEPFATMTGVLDGGFTHILLSLELIKPPAKKKQPDVENTGDEPPKPGTPGFTEAFKTKVDTFYASKQKTLEEWCDSHGIELPDNFFEQPTPIPTAIYNKDEDERHIHQRQLFFTLYLEYLLWRVGTSMLELILYIDKRKQQGALQKTKLIFPGSKTLYHWVKATFGKEDLSEEDSFTADMDSGAAQSMYLGQEFLRSKDPEHEPPTNGLQKMGERIRAIPKFFRSESSTFGLRVVAATMSIGIICYLRASQEWFLRQRLLWAMIMVAFSMNRTAGQSIFNFIMRVLGTAAAMVASYVIWYIVDGKTAGVIVFLWLWMFSALYIVMKKPKFAIVGILSLVTSILIIGYELQVRVIGKKAATSNGQPYYPVYELAPYRLATVTGGLLVAFIWTIFPFPISESTELRKDISASLYILSAYYDLVRETIHSRVMGNSGKENVKGTHAHHLQKARFKIFGKLVHLLTNLNTNSAFSQYQIRMGGRFPREEYKALIDCIRRLLLWTSLAGYSSMTFQDSGAADGKEPSKWASDLRNLVGDINKSSNKITSLLAMLSSALGSGQPLPPYIDMPEPMEFVRQIDSIDRDLLSIRHIAEPEYSAFAVMQIVSQSINTDIALLMQHVKNLVGVIDFSFHPLMSSADSSESWEDDDSQDDQKEKDKEA